jgi:rhodanese-related sulfurtransferase
MPRRPWKLRQHRWLWLLAGLLSSAWPAQADNPPAPEQITGVTRVEAEGVLELVQRERQLVIVDSRIKTDRRQGHIEGSVSLPDIATTCDSLARVIPGKNRPALFYCNGVKCGRSVVALEIAKRCGYRNLYWYRGGFEDWQHKGYPYLKQ